eukprot:127362-Chlamydomonas_euryale.AAC.4
MADCSGSDHRPMFGQWCSPSRLRVPRRRRASCGDAVKLRVTPESQAARMRFGGSRDGTSKLWETAAFRSFADANTCKCIACHGLECMARRPCIHATYPRARWCGLQRWGGGQRTTRQPAARSGDPRRAGARAGRVRRGRGPHPGSSSADGGLSPAGWTMAPRRGAAARMGGRAKRRAAGRAAAAGTMCKSAGIRRTRAKTPRYMRGWRRRCRGCRAQTCSSEFLRHRSCLSAF